jgi:hypothetical protein
MDAFFLSISFAGDFYYSRIKKARAKGEKCHARTMMHSKLIKLSK